MESANKAIVEIMGYSFKRNAVEMARLENFGIVSQLLKNVETFKDDTTLQKIGHDVLESLRGYNVVKNPDIAVELFKKGLPFADPRSAYISPDDIFFYLIRYMDDARLEVLLQEIDGNHQLAEHHRISDMKKSYCWAIVLRYRERKFCSTEFYYLLDFWIGFRTDDSCQNRDWKLEICRGVIDVAKERKFKFYSDNCMQDILNITKKLSTPE